MMLVIKTYLHILGSKIERSSDNMTDVYNAMNDLFTDSHFDKVEWQMIGLLLSIVIHNMDWGINLSPQKHPLPYFLPNPP